jgi:hypothetical protein
MRPTAKMRTKPGRAFDQPDESTTVRFFAPDKTFLAERRRQAVRALEQTRTEMRERSIDKAANEALRDAERRLTGPLAPGTPGIVTARVVGVPGKNEPAVPLAGIDLRLKVGEKVVAETQTDALGLGQLELPKNTRESYELEVVGPDCKVIACQRGSVDLETKESDSPTHLFEVARTEGLTPNFERAKPWQEALVTAQKRRDLTVRAVSTALEKQENDLIRLIAEIDRVLAR